MTNETIQKAVEAHEVGTPKDYAQQIIAAFKHLQHGVTYFNGIPVMEAGEEDMMYQIIIEALTHHDKEKAGERDALFQETNIKKFVAQMEDELEEDGDMHDEGCPCMMEDPDACDCETMKWAKMRCKEWMGKVNEMWVTNLQHHRKHCTPEGNKDMTRTKRKIEAIPPSQS